MYGALAKAKSAPNAVKHFRKAVTLNPADASAHYNLGLIHQQRGELELAVERFKRAVEIDPEEIDAYYQMGRIARQQKRVAEAIGYFEQVVSRNPAHSQYEIWREVGAVWPHKTALPEWLRRRMRTKNMSSTARGTKVRSNAYRRKQTARSSSLLVVIFISRLKTYRAR